MCVNGCRQILWPQLGGRQCFFSTFENTQEFHRILVNSSDFAPKYLIFSNFPEIPDWNTQDFFKNLGYIPKKKNTVLKLTNVNRISSSAQGFHPKILQNHDHPSIAITMGILWQNQQTSNPDFSATTEPILKICGALDQEKFTPSNKLISEEKGAVLKMTWIYLIHVRHND